MIFWYTLPVDDEGNLLVKVGEKLHRPKLESAKRLPADKSLDASGSMVALLVTNPKKKITAEEFNKWAFPSAEAAGDYLRLALPRVLAPKKNPVEQAPADPKPVSTVVVSATQTQKASALPFANSVLAGITLPHHDDDDEIIGGSPRTWVVYYEVNDGGKKKLKTKTVNVLASDVLEVEDGDVNFQCAESGKFPSARITKIAFVDDEQRVRFVQAYERGNAKKK